MRGIDWLGRNVFRTALIFSASSLHPDSSTCGLGQSGKDISCVTARLFPPLWMVSANALGTCDDAIHMQFIVNFRKRLRAVSIGIGRSM
jgi:hypothetical protein